MGKFFILNSFKSTSLTFTRSLVPLHFNHFALPVFRSPHPAITPFSILLKKSSNLILRWMHVCMDCMCIHRVLWMTQQAFNTYEHMWRPQHKCCVHSTQIWKLNCDAHIYTNFKKIYYMAVSGWWLFQWYPHWNSHPQWLSAHYSTESFVFAWF